MEWDTHRQPRCCLKSIIVWKWMQKHFHSEYWLLLGCSVNCSKVRLVNQIGPYQFHLISFFYWALRWPNELRFDTLCINNVFAYLLLSPIFFTISGCECSVMLIFLRNTFCSGLQLGLLMAKRLLQYNHLMRALDLNGILCVCGTPANQLWPIVVCNIRQNVPHLNCLFFLWGLRHPLMFFF